MVAVAFHLQKGGVGKTTLSTSVAYEAAKTHKTVLVDADPQGNSSTWLVTNSIQHDLADVLYGRASPSETLVEITPKLSVLPTFSLDGELKLYGENQLSREPFIFSDLVDSLQELGFEVVIFDLSPGMSQLERSVLMSTTEVLVPMLPDVFSIDGLEIFTSELRKIEKGFRRGIQHNRIIINGLDRRIAQHKEIHARALKTTYETFTVGQDPVFRKAQALHVPAQEIEGRDQMKPAVRAELARLAAVITGGADAA